ncbi:hypothetical protein ASZ90_003449 [hydrocarbon metagenome]|uniref:Uncharacterized protein n=1 Tax=hydrocarbon metagenome TaxID=938273 RepID=A0A0W8G0L6_9ZZZZ
MTENEKFLEDSKLFIKLMLSSAFQKALDKSPGGERLLINLAEEIEHSLGKLIKEIIQTEKKQIAYHNELIKYAKLVYYKSDMLNELKQNLKNAKN